MRNAAADSERPAPFRWLVSGWRSELRRHGRELPVHSALMFSGLLAVGLALGEIVELLRSVPPVGPGVAVERGSTATPECVLPPDLDGGTPGSVESGALGAIPTNRPSDVRGIRG